MSPSTLKLKALGWFVIARYGKMVKAHLELVIPLPVQRSGRRSKINLAEEKFQSRDGMFVRRCLIVLGIIAAAALVIFLRNLVVLIFGSVVIAVLLVTITNPLHRFTKLPRGAALALAIVIVLGVIAGAGAMFGTQIARQSQQISRQLPEAWNTARDKLAEVGFELPAIRQQAVPENAEDQMEDDQLDETAQIGGEADAGAAGLEGLRPDIIGRAGALLMSVFGGIVQTLLVVAGGIYLAAQPQLYRTGLLKMFPQHRRGLIAEAYDASGKALKLWLMGTLVSMMLVGVVTGVGLWLLGVPSALALGALAGLLEFVPIVGPIVAAIPAILVAFSVGPELALWTLGLFIIVQQVESNVIQPVVQRYAVDLPPALLLFTVVAGGSLFGFVGIIFAAPLTVVGYVLVKRLYVQEALGTETPLPHED